VSALVAGVVLRRAERAAAVTREPMIEVVPEPAPLR
jgi:hypothetical protein